MALAAPTTCGICRAALRVVVFSQTEGQQDAVIVCDTCDGLEWWPNEDGDGRRSVAR
jgi:hypothetical protein